MELFGFQINRKQKETGEQNLNKISAPTPDGSFDINIGAEVAGSYSYWLNWDSTLKDEKELLSKYRQVAMLSEASMAIDEIIMECIVVEDEPKIVEVQLDKTDFSEGIKNKITEEFNYLLQLLNFNNIGEQIFRQWYIDGRQYYHKVINTKKPKDGIQELNWLDPTRIKKVREIQRERKGDIEVIVGINEYFVYDLEEFDQHKSSPYFTFHANNKVLQIHKDSVAYVNSGLIDMETGQALSFLHKAVKPANQLAILEDSAVVYRLIRAPERRAFYVDVGKLPAGRAEQYLAKVMAKFKNDIIYNTKDGVVDANRAHIAMSEDIWLPRMEGGRGTEVQILQGGANLGEIEDIQYFRRRLYKSLNVPISRMESEAQVSIGVANEVTREELKFAKFCDGLTRRYNMFFYDILKTQLLLKNVITEEDWDNEQDNIVFEYNKDSYFSELKHAELIQRRIDLLNSIDMFAQPGSYFSKPWVKDNVLHLTEDEIKQIEEDWKEESKGPEEDSVYPTVDLALGVVPGQEPETAEPINTPTDKEVPAKDEVAKDEP